MERIPGIEEPRRGRLRMIAHERGWHHFVEPGADGVPGTADWRTGWGAGGSPESAHQSAGGAGRPAADARRPGTAGGTVAEKRAVRSARCGESRRTDSRTERATTSGEACGSAVGGPGRAVPARGLVRVDGTGESASQACVRIVLPVHGIYERRRGPDPGSF